MGSYTDSRRPHQWQVPVVLNTAIGQNCQMGSFIAPFAGQLIAAEFVNGVNITANATDFNVVTVSKAPSSNIAAKTVMATLNWGATNTTAGTPTALTINSSTVATVRVNAGDFVVVDKTATLNGTAGTLNIAAANWAGLTCHFLWDQYDTTV